MPHIRRHYNAGLPSLPQTFCSIEILQCNMLLVRVDVIRASSPTKIDASKEQPLNQYTGCCSNFSVMFSQHQKNYSSLTEHFYDKATMWRIKRSLKNMSLLEKDYAPLGRASVEDSTKSEIDDVIELGEVQLPSRRWRWTQSLPFQALPWILTLVFMVTSLAQYELRDKSCQSEEYSLLRPTDFSAYLDAA